LTAVVVQLSDPHIGAAWRGRDPAATLAAVVERVRALEPAAVLVTGDLTEHATDAEYELARELLAPLGAPLHVLPGNHDDRAAMRRHFDLPGAGDEPVLYTADAGSPRLVVLDSTRPGENGGELDAGRLAWLDSALAASDAPALIATHHPPIWSGLPAMDAIGLPAGDRAALGELLGRHPHVLGIVAGHAHRPLAGQLGGRAVVVAPSTYVQLRFDLRTEEIDLGDEPAGFALHALRDGTLASHVVMLDRTR
jgi:3',5'-cyclic-AMP phosphodiesterase